MSRLNLHQFINSQNELSKYISEIFTPIQFTYNECLKVMENPNLKINDTHLFQINTVIDYLHERLNTGHWSKVPMSYRYAFTAASFIKAVFMLQFNENENYLRDTLKYIDLGLLLGAPLPDNPELLNKCANYLTQELNKLCLINSNIKRKLSTDTLDINRMFDEVAGQEIKTVSCPSIELFNKQYFMPQIPVKLTDCMNHWAALKKWQDINYLLKIAGNRTVPIELGSSYTDENWGQKLMTLQDFIKNYFLSDDHNSLGYLAQHNLFDQIPELQNDISIPDYCCLSTNYEESTEPDINAWFGPKNTVSPLHYDPKNNFLTQVFGTKQVILFHPNDSQYLYPHEETLLNNTARVNPLDVDTDKHPLFKNTTMYKCLLKPGEMLFIPVKWWHHVTALEKSFSVSFWWQ